MQNVLVGRLELQVDRLYANHIKHRLASSTIELEMVEICKDINEDVKQELAEHEEVKNFKKSKNVLCNELVTCYGNVACNVIVACCESVSTSSKHQKPRH